MLFFRYDKGIYRNISLYGAGCADSDDVQALFVLFDFLGFQINVYESVQFIDYDVNVVRPDTRGNDTQPMSVVSACHGCEFPVAFLDLNSIEMGSD